MIKQLESEIKSRIKRCEYLIEKMKITIKVNPEQYEAYEDRFEWQKKKVLDAIDKLETLELKKEVENGERI